MILKEIIEGAIDQHFQRRVENVYPVNNTWASEIGHPCARFLVYRQTEWRIQKKFESYHGALFDLGNLHGKRALRVLEDALDGSPATRHIEVQQAEVSLPENEYGITGRLDCVLKIGRVGKRSLYVPGEVKGLADANYRKINCEDDMRNATAVYLRKYPGQLQIYMRLTETEHGVFILCSKQSGGFKLIDIRHDKAYTDALIAKAVVVKSAARKYKASRSDTGREKALPKRLDWTSTVCGTCGFLGVCIPDMAQLSGVENLLGDNEMEALCKEYSEVKEQAAAYRSADQKLKKHMKVICEGMEVGDMKTIMLPGHNVEVKIGEQVMPEMKARRSVYPRITKVEKV